MKLKNLVRKKLNLHSDQKMVEFSNLIFQLHCIKTPLILDQLACSLPKTNTTFHQLFNISRMT